MNAGARACARYTTNALAERSSVRTSRTCMSAMDFSVSSHRSSLRLTTFVSPRLAIACLTAPHHRALPASSHAWGPGTIAERPFLQRTSNSAYRSVLCPHASRNRSWNRNSDHNRNHAFFQKQIVDSVAYVDGKLTNQVLEKEAAKCEEKGRRSVFETEAESEQSARDDFSVRFAAIA